MENTDETQEEISLKELIQVLWGEKILIGVITIAALILTALYAFVFVTPTYQSSAFFAINPNNMITTSYGEYTLPFTAIDDYTSPMFSREVLFRAEEQLDTVLSVSQLKKSINIKSSQGNNTFKLVATATSPEQATELVDIYTESYLIHFKHTLISTAIDHFRDTFTTQIVIDNNDIQGIDKDIDNTLELLGKTDKAIVYGNATEINPGYRILLERVTQLQIQRSILERRIEQATLSLDELVAERESLATRAEGNTNSNLSKSLSGIVISIGQEVAQRTGKANSSMLVIGLALGFGLGLFVGLVKAYWKGQLG